MKDDKELSPELHKVAREKVTEAPFSGKYWDNHEKGMYKCAVCGAELFSSDTKFDSGTGWPSFTEPANPPVGGSAINLREDTGGGMTRTEVVCKQCGAHLGHVFDDSDVPSRSSDPEGRRSGPRKTGKRYCINSVCLELEKEAS